MKMLQPVHPGVEADLPLMQQYQVSFGGLFTFKDPDADSDPDSNPIPLVGSYYWNLNLTLCSVKGST